MERICSFSCHLGKEVRPEDAVVKKVENIHPYQIFSSSFGGAAVCKLLNDGVLNISVAILKTTLKLERDNKRLLKKRVIVRQTVHFV